jgi:hypothetical protein
MTVAAALEFQKSAGGLNKEIDAPAHLMIGEDQ